MVKRLPYPPERCAQLFALHSDLIEATRSRLAMDFDAPASSIIESACSQMGISARCWPALMQFLADQEGK